jgi:hypothetical protein
MKIGLPAGGFAAGAPRAALFFAVRPVRFTAGPGPRRRMEYLTDYQSKGVFL